MLGFIKKKLGPASAAAQPEMSETEYAQSIDDGYGAEEKLETGSSTFSHFNAKIEAEQNWIDAREGYQIMASHLWKSCNRKSLFSESPEVPSGVAIRFGKSQYVVCPAQDERLINFCQSVAILNCECAMTITSPVVKAINSRLAPGTEQIPITASQHIQVVDTMDQLAGARKAQNACFVRTEHTVVIWCDTVEQLQKEAEDLEEKMIKFVWASSLTTKTRLSHKPTASSSSSMSKFNMNQARYRAESSNGHYPLSLTMSRGDSSIGHNAPSPPASEAHSTPASIPHFNPFSETAATATPCSPISADSEKQDGAFEDRSYNYQAAVQHGIAVGLDIILCMSFVSQLLKHSLIDGNWSRMGLAGVTVLMFPVIMFFCDNIVGIIFQMFGPVRQLHQNSRYYSGKAPLRISGQLPHMTIQMPVYKESLEGVLMPTIQSVKKAISTYELQGGTASIIVSDDGMQLISQADQDVRQEFYEMHSIGWVSRPADGKDGYVRKGRFKKASNLNFTCFLSLAVEKMMAASRPQNGPAALNWTEADETELYERCLEQCLPELHPLAQAKGNVRIGDLILIIDSDTRVPEDCLLDAASEMIQSPDVGVLQHCSGVMLVSDSYFERGIAFFTRLVNFSISFMVSAGDVAPFMGHNAFLRWSAAQEASFVDPEDGVRKIWSESHVSEDFDMALRLLMSGYITRWATYSDNKFEEGVSLTCDDELNRWQKYAFGCSELVFNRIWEWPYKSPFTKLFRTFLWSKAPIHYKFCACSYIFSYYAIASALPCTFALYFATGWFYPEFDPVFLSQYDIWLAVVFVFIIGGNVSQVVARYRAKSNGLWALIKEHLTWAGFMVIFFGGLSFHVLTALLSHICGINMTWGATIKDLEDSNFFIEAPLILKRFWKVFLFCFVSIASIIVFQITTLLPIEWQILGFNIYWPLLLASILHFLYPIALNPALLRFSF